MAGRGGVAEGPERTPRATQEGSPGRNILSASQMVRVIRPVPASSLTNAHCKGWLSQMIERSSLATFKPGDLGPLMKTSVLAKPGRTSDERSSHDVGFPIALSQLAAACTCALSSRSFFTMRADLAQAMLRTATSASHRCRSLGALQAIVSTCVAGWALRSLVMIGAKRRAAQTSLAVMQIRSSIDCN
jgi:hypothetical protein